MKGFLPQKLLHKKSKSFCVEIGNVKEESKESVNAAVLTQAFNSKDITEEIKLPSQICLPITNKSKRQIIPVACPKIVIIECSTRDDDEKCSEPCIKITEHDNKSEKKNSYEHNNIAERQDSSDSSSNSPQNESWKEGEVHTKMSAMQTLPLTMSIIPEEPAASPASNLSASDTFDHSITTKSTEALPEVERKSSKSLLFDNLNERHAEKKREIENRRKMVMQIEDRKSVV